MYSSLLLFAFVLFCALVVLSLGGFRPLSETSLALGSVIYVSYFHHFLHTFSDLPVCLFSIDLLRWVFIPGVHQQELKIYGLQTVSEASYVPFNVTYVSFFHHAFQLYFSLHLFAFALFLSFGRSEFGGVSDRFGDISRYW